jgi:hypothetical protein
MSKIRIAYITDPLGTGGTERQLKYLLEGLDKSKFKIYLYLLRGTMDHPIRPTGVETRLLGVDSLLSVNGIRKLFYLSKELRGNNIQIVQTFFQDATVFGVVAAKMAKIKKIVVSIRDVLFWATPRNSWAHRWVCGKAGAILVNSKTVMERVEKYVDKVPIKVIYNGIPFNNSNIKNDLSRQSLANELGIRSEMPIVTLVANCNRYVKRVDLFLESIPLVLKEIDAFFICWRWAYET